jgi:hypothetical protein
MSVLICHDSRTRIQFRMCFMLSSSYRIQLQPYISYRLLRLLYILKYIRLAYFGTLSLTNVHNPANILLAYAPITMSIALTGSNKRPALKHARRSGEVKWEDKVRKAVKVAGRRVRWTRLRTKVTSAAVVAMVASIDHGVPLHLVDPI